MLVERVFSLGGLLVIAFGILLAALVYATGAWRYGVGLLLGPALMIGFGAFFLGVGRQARRDREALLALPETPAPPGGSVRPPAGGG